MKIGVFADKGDGHRVVQAVLGEGKSSPLFPEVFALLDVGGGNVNLFQGHSGGEKLDQLLVIQEDGNMVGRVDIVNSDNLLVVDVAEEGNLPNGC